MFQVARRPEIRPKKDEGSGVEEKAGLKINWPEQKRSNRGGTWGIGLTESGLRIEGVRRIGWGKKRQNERLGNKRAGDRGQEAWQQGRSSGETGDRKRKPIQVAARNGFQ